MTADPTKAAAQLADSSLSRIAGQVLPDGRGPQAEDLCDAMINATSARPESAVQDRKAAAFWERAMKKLDRIALRA
jgi:hypothetical protein